MKRIKTVLLVEDNQDDELLTIRALKSNGIAKNIIVVRDGSEALDYLSSIENQDIESFNELPSLIILDIQIPKINGLELLRIIRTGKRTMTIPVVVLTSSKDNQDIISSYELGANSFIRKAVNYENFMMIARQINKYWLELNEPAPV